MEVNSKDFLELAEQLYHEYKFIGISKTDFLEHVKKEVQAYTKYYSVNSAKEQIELLYQIMEKLLKKLPTENSQTENNKKRAPLSRTEERILLEKAAGGDLEARSLLIERNIGLVKSRALRYTGLGLPLDDLIQEGIISLMTAIDKYDLTTKNKLSTYATPYIDGDLRDYISESGKTVRFPKNIPDYLRKINNLEIELQREPSLEEIMEELKITKKVAQRLIRWKNSIISLNIKVDEDGETELGSFIEANELTEEQFMIRDMQEETHRLLHNLNEKEQQVLIMLYGLYGVRKHTLAEIAAIMNVTHQQISSIEATALRKLRRLDQIMDMSIYMDDPEAARENILFYREQYKDPKNRHKKNFEKPKQKVKK